MTAESDYEKARAERKEVGFEDSIQFTPEQVEQAKREAEKYHIRYIAETLCRRCRKPTEYQARWCYDCETAMFGEYC